MGVKKKKYLILGLGKSNLAVLDFLRKNDVSDDDLDVLKDDKECFFDGINYEIGVASPGISEFSDFYCKAKDVCDEVISELEFAYRASVGSGDNCGLPGLSTEIEKNSKWVIITGTNGKTTTTSLVSYILDCAHIKNACVGNIGEPAIAHVDGNQKVYVCEASSFQLASANTLSPDVFVMLNITPDHIVWHKTFENYANAKFEPLRNMVDSSKLSNFVYNVEDPVIKDILNDFDFANSNVGACPFSGTSPKIDANLKILGAHNLKNARAAYLACASLGVDECAINDALSSFSPLEHRIEPCGEVAGVKFVNDSKATNTDATIKAVKSFDKNVVLMLGGVDKMGSLDELVCACMGQDECVCQADVLADGSKNDVSSLQNDCVTNTKSAPKAPISAIVFYGEAKDRFFNKFSDDTCGIDLICEDSFAQAFEAGFKMAFSIAQSTHQTATLLLSPACASFDEFSGFEERGQAFKELAACKIEGFKS